MKWVTRERPRVDRVACPWLIRRFVDPKAKFLYAPADQVLAVAVRERGIAYDIEGAVLGHHGDECSFDAIVRAYGLDTDPALRYMAKVVRGADTRAHDLTPESRGLLAVCEGLSRAYDDDQAQLAAAMPVFEALYRYCQTKQA